MSADMDKSIRERAYDIWENEGRPEGRSEQHWEQARAELTDQNQSTSATGKRKPAEAKPHATKAKRRTTKTDSGTKRAAGSADGASTRKTAGRSTAAGTTGATRKKAETAPPKKPK